MTWSPRAIVVNAVIGVAIVLLQWAWGSILESMLSPSGWWYLLLMMYLLAAGFLVAWRLPRGFLGASIGVFVAAALPAQLVGGATAKTLDPFFALVAAAIVALGEWVGLGLRLRAAKRGHA